MDSIIFHTEDIEFALENENFIKLWLSKIIGLESKITGEINYIFCSDTYLHKINLEHLNHDTYTDIITFDYVENGIISGDIFISIDRVKENALTFEVDFNQELNRVMAHGVLHLIGFKDKNSQDQTKMSLEEDKALELISKLK